MSQLVGVALAMTAWLGSPIAGQDGASQPMDFVIAGGQVFDGLGGPPRRVDLGIVGDRIVALGDLANAPARVRLNVAGLAVAPGFINMLSWSTESLLVDGRGSSEILQGVVTQIMGEGHSWGPVNPAIVARMKRAQTDIRYDIEWRTLAEYLRFLERKGTAHNVASYLGATTVREFVIGNNNRKASQEELAAMCQLVEREMRDGALGIASSLEYAPAYYADTEELIALCKAAARWQGKYISHLRSEGPRLLEAIDELIRIAREANIPAEIYHLKAAGIPHWPKMEAAIQRIEAARRQGLRITADMYCYTAGATGLDACIPAWASEGGSAAMRRRLRDPALRPRIAADIRRHVDNYPNFYLSAGSPENIRTIAFKSKRLKPLQGKTLAEIARQRGADPVETLIDLLIEDESDIGTAYFNQSEDVVRRLIALPWMSFCSDSASQVDEGVFLLSMPHPRGHGNFARLLGKYVREQKLLPLQEAIRKLTSLPATNLGLADRGRLAKGCFADVAIFDPKTIADRATFEMPHQYAVGMKHVFVNGAQVVRDGRHTGAKPGRALFGPGRVEGAAATK